MHAEKAGYAAVIIFDNIDEPLLQMYYEGDSPISIPSYFISKQSGEFMQHLYVSTNGTTISIQNDEIDVPSYTLTFVCVTSSMAMISFVLVRSFRLSLFCLFNEVGFSRKYFYRSILFYTYNYFKLRRYHLHRNRGVTNNALPPPLVLPTNLVFKNFSLRKLPDACFIIAIEIPLISLMD